MKGSPLPLPLPFSLTPSLPPHAEPGLCLFITSTRRPGSNLLYPHVAGPPGQGLLSCCRGFMNKSFPKPKSPCGAAGEGYVG